MLYPEGVLARHREKWHEVEGPLDTPCYIWDRATTKGGYPKINTYRHGTLGVHRLTCEEVNGPPPPGKWDASHMCHNALCVNGAHLKWEPHHVNMWRIRNRDEEPPHEFPPLPIEPEGFYGMEPDDIVTLFS